MVGSELTRSVESVEQGTEMPPAFAVYLVGNVDAQT